MYSCEEHIDVVGNPHDYCRRSEAETPKSKLSGVELPGCRRGCRELTACDQVRGVQDEVAASRFHLPVPVSEICVNHEPHQLAERGGRFPAKFLAGLGGVADEKIYFSRAIEAVVLDDELLPVQIDMAEGLLQKLADTVCFAGGNNVVIRIVLLEHQPHCAYIVRCEAPITARIQIPQPQLVAKAELDAGDTIGDLVGHEFQAAARAFVVEEDAGGRRRFRSSRGSLL